MLIKRSITALCLLVALYLVLFKLPVLGFLAVIWLVSLLGLYELVQMYNFNSLQQLLIFVIFTVVLLFLANGSDLGFNLHYIYYLQALIVFTWCFLIPLILITQPVKFSKIAVTLLGMLVFLPAAYAMFAIRETFGAWNLVAIMAIAWVNDIGAYFFGKAFGRHKLAPQISPGKSIEGAISGLICAIIYLFILQHYTEITYLRSTVNVLKIAILLSVVSVMGDLFESWLKRVAKVKDSGNILPGHGGVMDRIDSLVAVVAVAFAMLWQLVK